MKSLLLIEATDEAYQEKKRVQECKTIRQCLSDLVYGSAHRFEKNVPDKIESPKSAEGLRQILRSGNQYIHLSCHGNSKELILPGQKTFRYDLFNSLACLSTTELLFINACEVGSGPAAISALASLCDGRVSKKYVIAPTTQVYFETALIFSILFYDYLIIRRMSVVDSFLTASRVEGFSDLEYVCFDAQQMKEYYIRDGRRTVRRLQF